MTVNGIFSALKTTLSGLSTQTKKMELISENMANVEKTADENGNLYQRKVLDFQKSGNTRPRRFAEAVKLQLRRSHSSHITSRDVSGKKEGTKTEFNVLEESGEQLLFDPDHPRADEQGYVRVSNVNMIEEMMDLISTSRIFEANVTVMNAAKQMAKRSLEI